MTIVQELQRHGIEYRLDEAKREVRVACPACETRKSPRFKCYINERRRVAYCFRCQKVWYNLGQLRKALGIEDVGDRLLDTLETAVGLVEEEDEETTKPPLDWFPAEAVPALDVKAARKYLFERGLTKAQITQNLIHYCPEGVYKGRVLIPVFNGKGTYLFFVARKISKEIEGPPYLYPGGAPVRSTLYPEDVARKWGKHGKPWLLVEGAFDAIHIRGYGTAIFGTAMSDQQIALLHKWMVHDICFMLDADIQDPSHEAYKSFQKMLQRLSGQFRVRNVILPDGTDPDDHPIGQLLRWALDAPVIGSVQKVTL